jgi:serine/threonine-protein kinase RsbW
MEKKKRNPVVAKVERSNGGHPRTLFEMECISMPAEIRRVELFLEEVNKQTRLDDGTFHRLFVSATEAVNNAILHGNKSDPAKKVCVQCLVNKDSVVVSVTDEGRGFDPASVPNPLDEQNLLKESGRGIFLIRSMMDRVDFQSTATGTKVEMAINLKRLR